MKPKKILFSKIKPGKFFRMAGNRALLQRCADASYAAQYVSGRGVGGPLEVFGDDVLVTPVSVKIVETK